jgi:aminomethyltransferase
LRQLAEGAPRRRIGIRPEGRAPAREETPISNTAGNPIGQVTSGGFGPSVGAPIAMGYVAAAHAAPGAPLSLLVRGRPRPARVSPLPFVPHNYHRG